MQIPISALAIGGLAGDKPGRYATNCVQFLRDQDGQARAVATDGRVFGLIEWKEPRGADEKLPGYSGLVPAEDLAKVARVIACVTLGKTQPPVTLVESASQPPFLAFGQPDSGAYRLACEQAIRPFPNWQGMLESIVRGTAVTIMVNPEKLIALLTAAMAATDQDHPVVALTVPEDSGAAVLVTAVVAEKGRFFGALMPVVPRENPPKPLWIPEVSPDVPAPAAPIPAEPSAAKKAGKIKPKKGQKK